MNVDQFSTLCKVYLNQKRIPVHSFVDYVKLYFKNQPELPVAFEKITDSEGRRRWEIAVTVHYVSCY